MADRQTRALSSALMWSSLVQCQRGQDYLHLHLVRRRYRRMRRRRRGRHCSTLATLMRPQDQRSLTFLAWSKKEEEGTTSRVRSSVDFFSRCFFPRPAMLISDFVATAASSQRSDRFSVPFLCLN